jgi:hypothetical protein
MMLTLILMVASGQILAEQAGFAEPIDTVVVNENSGIGPSAYSHYQLRFAGGNPWALPEPADRPDVVPPQWQAGHGHQQAGRNDAARNDNYTYETDNQWSGRSGRFVTPEFLQSLKRQQEMTQQVYPQQTVPVYPQYPSAQQYGTGSYYSNPGAMNAAPPQYQAPYGLGGYNPVYDVPAVSPWSMTPESLLKGESFNYVPDEAIGGIAPMDMPVYGPGINPGEAASEFEVFNPYTYLKEIK